MQTVPLLLGSLGANSRCSWVAFPRQIAWQRSLQAPRREVVEWTPKGSGRGAARTPVFPEVCLAIYDRMSHPNSSAAHPERDELPMENSDAGLLFGRQST